jgi:hypothetical protein
VTMDEQVDVTHDDHSYRCIWDERIRMRQCDSSQCPLIHAHACRE